MRIRLGIKYRATILKRLGARDETRCCNGVLQPYLLQGRSDQENLHVQANHGPVAQVPRPSAGRIYRRMCHLLTALSGKQVRHHVHARITGMIEARKAPARLE